MKAIIYIFILFSILHVLNAYSVKYSGHKVLRCTFDKILVPKIKKYAETHNIDIWDLSPGKLDVHITPEQEKELEKYKSFFQCVDFIPDLQSAIEHSDHRSKARSDNFFESYHSYDEIVQWMNDLVDKYPSLLTMVEIGKTHQNRTMYAIELNGVNQESDKTIYYQSNQHSREWISHMTVSYIIYSLVEAYGKNPTVTRIVDELNWRFVVMVNPDGYTYSRTNDRMWRKNRRTPPAGSSCYGVDTNRNWPAYWNRGGSSSNPCSDTYMGSSAASEIEVRNVIAYWKSLVNVVVSTDYHSYGQEVMTPWGWTTSKPQEPDYTLQTTLARKYVASVKQIDGKTYTVGTAGSFGIGSGGFDDYGYYEGTLYSQTVELRDTGRYGFLLPASEIIPTGNENFNGVITQAIHVLDG